MRAPQVQLAVIVDALQLACRAPSLHNSQPWRWVATDHTVELFADTARMVRSADTAGRQALLSCGAVLDHFRGAMAAAGWATTVHRFPNPDDPHHVATLEFSAAPVSAAHRRRADAILVRRTDRLPLAAPPDRDQLARILGEGASSDAARVDVVADESRGSLAEASYLTEILRLYDSEYHYELHWWTADFVASEGIPRSSLISATESERVDIGRAFPVVPQSERRSHVEEDHSKILVLSTEEDTRDSVLRCGETLSAVLLSATMAGLSTCTLTHIIEVPAGRDVVASLLPGDTIPQVIVRVGVAPVLDSTPPPTPRRPIDEVLQIRRGPAC